MRVDNAELHRIIRVEPVQSRILNRGNGRRFHRLPLVTQDSIPLTADIAEVATHQVIFDGADRNGSLVATTAGDEWTKDHRYNMTIALSPGLLESQAIIVIFGSTEGVDRPPLSKALVTRGLPEHIFFIMTWTDLFGYPIKESALESHVDGKRLVFLREATRDESMTVLGALVRHPRIA